MREMKGNGFELGMGMAAIDVDRKHDARNKQVGSMPTINDQLLTREVKLH